MNLKDQLEALPEDILLWAILGYQACQEESVYEVLPDPDTPEGCSSDWLISEDGVATILLPAQCNACSTEGNPDITKADSAREAMAAFVAELYKGAE